MNNVATASGLMTILARLAEGSAVSKAASAEMLDVLRGQKFNEGIPAGLPKGTAVAHKTGSFQGVYHDAGVVEVPGRKPFVLVVLPEASRTSRRPTRWSRRSPGLLIGARPGIRSKKGWSR